MDENISHLYVFMFQYEGLCSLKSMTASQKLVVHSRQQISETLNNTGQLS